MTSQQRSNLKRLPCGHIPPAQAAKIHNASLEVLERTGARFYLQEAIDMLSRAGASVSEGNRVRIPARLVEWAFTTVRSGVTLYDRNGLQAMDLQGFNCYFGTGSDCLNILDHRNGERRLPVLADVVDGTGLCDALPNIDFVMSMFLPVDVDPMVADRYQMAAMLNHTTKPIVYVTPAFSGTEDANEMAEAVAGGAEALQKRPFVVCYINVTTGLRHNEEALRKLLFLSEKGLPYTYVPVTQGGVTAPVTVAASFISMNAGVLAGLVLSQLRREGSPFVVPGQGGEGLDLRTMVSPYAAPDDRPLCRAMGHYYKLPIFGLAGSSDSKLVDEQAAAEAALTLLSDAVGGANLIHDLGYLESGLCGSLVQLAICDEIVGWIRHLLAPVRMDDDALAVDLIDAVGPDGDFLNTEHTLANFRQRYYPTLFDRNNYDKWQARGALRLAERATERVEKLLSNHESEPLEPEAARAVRSIVERSLERAGS
jgi:trimethylamine---corrinoid protein Co-methyltransferase